eukprot:29130-Pelagococcus_subviridis.AAC.2
MRDATSTIRGVRRVTCTIRRCTVPIDAERNATGSERERSRETRVEKKPIQSNKVLRDTCGRRVARAVIRVTTFITMNSSAS